MDFANASWAEMLRYGIAAIVAILLLARMLLRG
jgi:hypothetical protein